MATEALTVTAQWDSQGGDEQVGHTSLRLVSPVLNAALLVWIPCFLPQRSPPSQPAGGGPPGSSPPIQKRDGLRPILHGRRSAGLQAMALRFSRRAGEKEGPSETVPHSIS